MPASQDQEHEQLRNDVSMLMQFVDEFDAKIQVKQDLAATALRAEIQALRGELAEARAVLEGATAAAKQAADAAQGTANNTKVTAERAETKANAAATRAELANYLPKAGGTITGDLAVNNISASTLTVGNIYGHGRQQIHMPGGSNADGIFLNWNAERRGNVYVKGTYVQE